MAKTFEDVVEEIRVHREEDDVREGERKSDSNRIIELLASMGQFVQKQVGIAEDERDERRAKKKKESGPGYQNIRELIADTSSSQWLRTLGMLGLAIGITIGYFRNTIKLLGKFSGINKLIKLIVGRFSRMKLGLRPLVVLFDKISDLFNVMKTSLSSKLIGVIQNLTVKFPKVFKTLRSILTKTSEFFKKFSLLGERIISLLRNNVVFRQGAAFMDTVKNFFGVFKKAFALGMKLSGITTIVLGSISGIVKGIKKFKETGDKFAALEIFFSEFLKNILTVPLDLLRQGAAWIADKVGLDGVSDMLKSFSFSDIFDRIVEGIRGMFDAFFEILFDPDKSVGQKIMAIVDGVWESIKNFITSAFTMLKDKLFSWGKEKNADGTWVKKKTVMEDVGDTFRKHQSNVAEGKLYENSLRQTLFNNMSNVTTNNAPTSIINVNNTSHVEMGPAGVKYGLVH